MSTRCNIIIKDKYDELIFYRHSDGYPEGAMPLLETFLRHVKEGTIRDNVGQAGGWLILLGAAEYQTVSPEWFKDHGKDKYGNYRKDFDALAVSTWQAGAIGPTTAIHGDIEFLYVIDLDTKEITVDPPYDGKFGEWRGKVATT